MKKLVVLSGNSPRNQEWGESAAKYFGDWFDEVYLQYYDHWQKGTKDMDVEVELAKLKTAVAEQAEYYVLAKSIGSVLALIAVDRGFLKPEKCAFFGMPLEIASGDLFRGDWSPLRNFTVPTIAFHNDEDPISYTFTKQALEDHAGNNIEFITRRGDNHNYTEFEEFNDKIKLHFAL